MSLTAGQTLSHYEILGPLGAGGMGEVWRARDVRLEREVAIKVLPQAFVGDADRLRRFEREAKTLAALNHPNVAGIHGVDQVEETCFLALELVPGEDLATLLKRGPLPLDEALDICRQIAEGLEAAHEAGVIHRDLKPANVRITPDGTAKVLDFGLAKPMQPEGSEDGTTSAQSDSFLMTEEGVVLGTPVYMSPEQARGKPVDRRTDVWAFGCVLFECLTGKRVFTGSSFGDVLAAVIGQDPDWSLLPPLPSRVEELLRRALVRDPRARLRDIGEARVQLELARSDPGSDAATRARPARLAITLAAVGLAFAAGWFVAQGDEVAPSGPSGADAGTAGLAIHAQVHEFPLEVPGASALLSPDGRQLAWSERGKGLFVRSLDSRKPRRIYDGSTLGFCWSPDGTELALLVDQQLTRISLASGRLRTVPGGGPVADDDFPLLAWMPEGVLLVGTRHEVWSLPAEGGQREVLYTAEEDLLSHWHFLHLLPDGAFLGALHDFSRPLDTVSVYRDGESEVVFHDDGANLTHMALRSDGTLIYGAEKSGHALWSVQLSLDDHQALGPPMKWLDGGQDPSLANDGTVLYATGGMQGLASTLLAWFDLGSGELTTFGDPHEGIRSARLSEDRERIVFCGGELAETELWMYDLVRELPSPLHSLQGLGTVAGWLPDGRLFLSMILGPEPGTFVFPLSGRGEPERVHEDVLNAVSPDGQAWVLTDSAVAFTPLERMVGPGIDGERLPYLRAEDEDRFVAFSPDGEWMLYTSQRSEVRRLYLTRFPPVEGQEWLVADEEFDAAYFSDDLSAILCIGDPELGEDGEEQGGVVVSRLSLRVEPDVDIGPPQRLHSLDRGVTVQDHDGAERLLVTVDAKQEPRRLWVITPGAQDN